MVDTQDGPDFIIKSKSETVPEDPARELLRVVEENDPLKPWTLISRADIDMNHHDIRVQILRPLALEGVLTPTADGNIRIHEKSRLQNII